ASVADLDDECGERVRVDVLLRTRRHAQARHHHGVVLEERRARDAGWRLLRDRDRRHRQGRQDREHGPPRSHAHHSSFLSLPSAPTGTRAAAVRWYTPRAGETAYPSATSARLASPASGRARPVTRASSPGTVIPAP